MISELTPDDLSHSSTSPIDESQHKIYKLKNNKDNFDDILDLSNIIGTTDSTETSNEKVIIETDIFVHDLMEKLSSLLIKSPTTENASSKASILLSTLTNGDIQQQKEILSSLLLDSFQSKHHVEVATQVTDKNIL